MAGGTIGIYLFIYLFIYNIIYYHKTIYEIKKLVHNYFHFL